MSYDVILCGAGPGGAMAATILAAGGARVLLLDRQRLPRDKACGGGLTGPALRLLPPVLRQALETTAETTHWGFGFGQDRVDIASGTLGMVRRRDFDMRLVQHALTCGDVTVRDGVTVARIEEDARGVTVHAKSGEQWRAEFVIGADGAAGMSAASVGLGRRTPAGIALDVDIVVPPEIFAAHAGHASFEFGVVEEGYAWIFPKNGYLSCGVGSGGTGARLPIALDRYLARTFPKGAILSQRRRGGALPLYEGPGRIASRRVLLVGDAANLVDPIMGEGITYALWSGKIAGEALLERLADNAAIDDGLDYSRRVHAAFGADLDRLRRYICPIAERSPRLFFRRFFLERGSYVSLARTLGERFEGGSRSFPETEAVIWPAASARNVQS